MTEYRDTPLWEQGPRSLPEVVGEVRADACVVGLGGSGLSAVARLVEAGRRVVGLDAVGVAAGAAGRNGGFLLAGPAEFHHRLRARLGAELASQLYELTLEARDRLLKDIPGADSRGSLRLPADDAERIDCLAHLEALIADGFAAAWLDPNAECEGGLLIPGDGVFDPVVRCQHLADQVADHAQLYGNSPAIAVESERVQTPRGAVRAETVLVCVDGGLERALPTLEPWVRSRRLQMLATAPAADVSVTHAIYHRFGHDYWHQRPDGRIALGGARDVGEDEEETVEPGISKKVQSALDTILRDRIKTRAEVTHRWSGIVAYSSDSLPIAEEVISAGPGVFACGAYSGHGNVLGALAGEALADMSLGRPTPPLIDWLRDAR